MAGEAYSAYVRFFVKDDVSGKVDKVEKSAKKAADGMDEAADSAGNNLTDGFKKAESGAGSLIKGLGGVIAGLGAMVGAIIGISNATADFQEDMGKLQTAFAVTGHSAETAQSVYNDFVGLLGETDQAVEASNHLAELTNNTQELSTWGTIGAGVYAKFGDSLPLEGLTEAANETAKVGTVTGSLADALNWAGVNEDEFNAKLAQCATEQERASLITSTLNGLYSEAGNKYKEINGDLIANRQAQSDWNAAMAGIGAVLRPIATTFMELGVVILEQVQPYLEGFALKLQEVATAIAPILAAAFQGILWILTEMWPLLVVIGGIYASWRIYIAVINGIRIAMTLWHGITLAFTAAQRILNAVLRANPIMLVVSLITMIVTAIVTWIMKNEELRAKVAAVFENIKNTIGGAIEGIKNFFVGLWTTVQEIWNKVVGFIKGAIQKIKDALTFKWEWPKIPLPHFKFEGSINPLEWGPGGEGVPRISVEWYAKGAIFDKPTLFATAAGLKGVGEAGPEAVAPLSELMGYVRQAVAEAGGAGSTYNATINVQTGETSEDKLARMIKRENKKLAHELGVL